jgi:hypothetical protein
MCVFVVLCVDKTYYMREYSDAIKVTKSYPRPFPVVGRDYRLSNFWPAKEVIKEFSALIFRLRCISIARKKIIHLYLKNIN